MLLSYLLVGYCICWWVIGGDWMVLGEGEVVLLMIVLGVIVLFFVSWMGCVLLVMLIVDILIVDGICVGGVS